MIRRPPRSTRVRSSAASDVYKRQHRACHGSLPRRNTYQQGLASVQAPCERALAAHEHAVDSTAAVSLETAAVSDGWLAAAAHASVATAAPPQLVKRPQSLAWLFAEAEHRSARLSQRAGSRRTCIGTAWVRCERVWFTFESFSAKTGLFVAFSRYICGF